MSSTIMDLCPEADEYIRESIENSLGLPASAKTLQLKLLASEDSRHRLQDQLFLLQDRLKETEKRLEQYKAEANMNAQGMKRCVKEKELIASAYSDLANHCAKLERECALYEQDIEKFTESCDELGRENDELRTRLNDASSIAALVAEVESLQKDKEHLRTNLHRAEEEVKLLFDENNILDEENKRLLRQLYRERHHQGSGSKESASASVKGKRKSRPKESGSDGKNISGSAGKAIDFSRADSPRKPLSPLQQNSPDSRVHKK